jgi:glycerol-3-phosphate dehydrogenase subunit C
MPGEHSGEIRYAPTDGLTYNPNVPLYWDKAALEKEVVRTFDLCHGCRLCFKFCQSFPTLFRAVDEAGDVRRIPDAVRRRVIDECFQCKLCYTQCPYTAAEGHEFRIDFPRLIARAKAVIRRDEGIPLVDKLLADPDRLGAIGTILPAVANLANRVRPNRVLMEKVAGIHRGKLLPSFESPTFEQWFRRQTGGADQTAGGRHPVVLFATCFVNYNRTAPGRAAFNVLTHNECRVACPRTECCGMPALDAGDVRLAQQKARRNVRTLLPWVERGYTIAVVNPTCSLTIRQEYPELLDDPADRGTFEAATLVAAATRDLSEYLFELKQAGKFKEDFQSAPSGGVACHAPCHLRLQKVGFRGRDLLRRIPGVKPKLVAECCGHDGTWAMKKDNFEHSLANGARAFEGMREADAAVWASDCPLASIQFEQACGRQALHPVEILDRAYRPDGFPAGPAKAAGEPA